MRIHYKTDLLNDAQLAAFALKVGDKITLQTPDREGESEHTILEVETTPAKSNPDFPDEHLTCVTLKLEAD